MAARLPGELFRTKENLLLVAYVWRALDVGRELILTCGYHRRDEELAELDAVVAGARRFADLPPRV